MQGFIREQNIKLLRQALEKETDPANRAVLERLLEEQEQMHLARKQDEAPPEI